MMPQPAFNGPARPAGWETAFNGFGCQAGKVAGKPGGKQGKPMGKGNPKGCGLPKGGGCGGKGKGKGDAARTRQTTQMRSWFQQVPAVPGGAQPLETQTSGVGRGRAVVQPAWMEEEAARALSSTVGEGEEYDEDEEEDWLRGIDSEEEQADEWPVQKWHHERRQACRESLSDGERNAWACPVQLEVEVTDGFDADQHDGWLTCQPGEVVLVTHACGDNIFATAHSRTSQDIGWLPSSVARLAPYYEFLVKLAAPREHSPDDPTPSRGSIGIVFAVATTVPALCVVDVLSETPIEAWNRQCLRGFPRDQVLPGDFITGVDGKVDIEAMRHALSNSSPRRLRFLRGAGMIEERLLTDRRCEGGLTAVLERKNKRVEESTSQYLAPAADIEDQYNFENFSAAPPSSSPFAYDDYQ